MAETIQTLEELSSLKPAAAPQPPKYVQKLDKQGRAYATGKRKDAVARVWIKMGAGKIVINDAAGGNLFCPAGAAHADPAAAGRGQPPGPIRRRLHGVGRRPVGPGRRGASRPVQGADAARAGFAAVLKRGGFLTRDSARGRAQEVRQAPKRAEASSSRSGNRRSRAKRARAKSRGAMTGSAKPSSDRTGLLRRFAPRNDGCE